MQEDLVRGYRNFLLGSVKTYFLGKSIIQDEIDFFTKKELKDGLLFFLCVFEKVDAKLLKTIHYEDEAAFKKYITLSNKGMASVTPKGKELKKYLEEKFAIHATMLEFNGIKPQYIGKVTTMLKRFEKFWQMILSFSRKKQLDELISVAKNSKKQDVGHDFDDDDFDQEAL